MGISMDSNKTILEIIAEYTMLFDPFKHVYLFGSALSPQVIPNDVDLLLIYTNYTAEISNALKEISDKLEQVLDLPIDITALSVEEERETAFLKKLKLHFIKIK